VLSVANPDPEERIPVAIIKAFTGAIGGTFADQWKEIVTAGSFDELTAVAPGILKQPSGGRGSRNEATPGVISNGSKIFVPENTAAYILSQAGIEDIMTEAGGYEYRNGQSSVFSGGDIKESLFDQVAKRVGFGGQTPDQKQIAFVNLREIRGIKFGTRGPVVYNDLFYGTDLHITAFGTFSLRVVNAETFIRKFLPASVLTYSFSMPEARQQIASEFIQSFVVAVNSLSSTYRISQLPAQAHAIAAHISDGSDSAGHWVDRFGIEVVNVGIESIEFTPESRELVKQYSANLMNLKAYDGVSQQSSNISAQQKIAQGVQDHGLGEGGGLLFGMNLAQGMNTQTGAQGVQGSPLTLDEQIEAVKKMKELLDGGLLTEEEFASKKREIMGL